MSQPLSASASYCAAFLEALRRNAPLAEFPSPPVESLELEQAQNLCRQVVLAERSDVLREGLENHWPLAMEHHQSHFMTPGEASVSRIHRYYSPAEMVFWAYHEGGLSDEGAQQMFSIAAPLGEPNWVNQPSGILPLTAAARHGSFFLQWLLDNGADPNGEQPRIITTPLQGAAENGQIECMRRLVERGAKVNALSANRESALSSAVHNVQLAAVRLLLEQGADASVKCGLPGDTVAHAAAKASEVELLELLRLHGANFTAPGFEGNTPLHYAATSECADTVEWLIQNGANLQAVNEKGLTPGQLALQQGGPWAQWFKSRLEKVVLEQQVAAASPKARRI